MFELMDAEAEGREEIAGDRADVVMQKCVFGENCFRFRLRGAVLQNELLDVFRPVVHERLVATLAVLQKNAVRIFLLFLQIAKQLFQA